MERITMNKFHEARLETVRASRTEMRGVNVAYTLLLTDLPDLGELFTGISYPAWNQDKVWVRFGFTNKRTFSRAMVILTKLGWTIVSKENRCYGHSDYENVLLESKLHPVEILLSIGKADYETK